MYLNENGVFSFALNLWKTMFLEDLYFFKIVKVELSKKVPWAILVFEKRCSRV